MLRGGKKSDPIRSCLRGEPTDSKISTRLTVPLSPTYTNAIVDENIGKREAESDNFGQCGGGHFEQLDTSGCM